jgi:hypothetical protein
MRSTACTCAQAAADVPSPGIVTGSEIANAILAVADVVILPVAALASSRVARRFERENPARMPWTLLAAGLWAFWVGEAIEGAYTVRGADTPFPGPPDACFLLGYPLLVAAFFLFLRAYRASGLADWGTEDVVAAAAIVGLIGLAVAVPVARAALPAAERVISAVYVLLDLVALIPLLVLLRLASRLRGGSVWHVWASLLFGFLLTFAGDVLFAFARAVAESGQDAAAGGQLELASSVVFTLSYLAIARGTRYQRRLLGGTES